MNVQDCIFKILFWPLWRTWRVKCKSVHCPKWEVTSAAGEEAGTDLIDSWKPLWEIGALKGVWQGVGSIDFWLSRLEFIEQANR